LRWAKEVGVDFGLNFTQGLPPNWNATAKAAPAKVEKKAKSPAKAAPAKVEKKAKSPAKAAPAKVEKKAKSPAKAVEEFSLLNDEET